jgi:WD40 repeat protein
MDRRWSRRRVIRSLALGSLTVWSSACALPAIPPEAPTAIPDDATAPDATAPTATVAPDDAAVAPRATAPPAIPPEPGRLGRARPLELAWSAADRSVVVLDIEGASWFDAESGVEWRRTSLAELTRPLLLEPYRLGLAPDGGTIIVRTAGAVQAVDSGSGAVLVRHDAAGLTADGPLAWSADGRWLALGGADAVLLLDRTAPQALAALALEGTVIALGWAPDGASLAAVGEAGAAGQSPTRTLFAWDAAQRSEVYRRTLADDERGVPIGAGDQWHMIGATDAGLLQEWRVDGVRRLEGLAGARAVAAAVAPDGGAVAVECAAQFGDAAAVLPRFFDSPESRPAVPVAGRILELADSTTRIAAIGTLGQLRWSADGTLLVGSSATSLDVWTRAGAPIARMPWHNTGVPTALAWSPDGSLLVSGGGGVVALWRVADGACLGAWPGGSGGGAEWMPDGSYALCDGVLIDAATGQPVRRFGDGAVGFFPDGGLVVYGAECSVMRYELATGRISAILSDCANHADINSLSPDRRRVAVYESFRSVPTWGGTSIYDVATGALLDEATDPEAYDGFGYWVSDGGSYRWSAAAEPPATALRNALELEYETPIVPASPDGQLIAAFDDAGRIIVWSTAQLSEVRRIETGMRLSAVAWSPDGTQLAVAAQDVGIRLWQIGSM